MPSVLVTGSSQGLGYAMVRQYAHEGVAVFAACLDAAASADLQKLAQQYAAHSVHEMDVIDANKMS
jgi:NAD(P)-dependent dehydrogenase (short-subunit alcohol dehydrogenase family)